VNVGFGGGGGGVYDEDERSAVAVVCDEQSVGGSDVGLRFANDGCDTTKVDTIVKLARSSRVVIPDK